MSYQTKLLTGGLAVAFLLTGCETEDPAVFDDTPAAAPEEPAPAMPMQEDELGPQLEANMQRARAADAQEFRRMFPEHRDLVNAMLDECREMMRDMGMTPPRQFTRVEEALEEDLRQIPNLSDEELANLKPDHLDRVQAVMDMRDDMMQDMGM